MKQSEYGTLKIMAESNTSVDRLADPLKHEIPLSII
jgi:hypothetical protein